ncbi:MAG: ribokinase [Chloroflexota bacterium]
MIGSSLAEIVRSWAGKRVLVVGDVCLDEYLFGRPVRLSREAPVPVLEFTRRQAVPGAAANPALNVVRLGGRAAVVGVVGADETGEALKALLAEAGIDICGLVTEPGRTTTLKTRILAEGILRFPQQVARLDRLDRQPLPASVQKRVLTAVTELAAWADAILVSDYRLGVVDGPVPGAVLTTARGLGRPVTVDSQGGLDRFAGYTLVRCNQAEAEAALGRPLAGEEAFRAGLAELRTRLQAEVVVVTRGAEGLSVATPAGYHRFPAANLSEVFDVTGAGDTVIAVLTLALLAGAEPWQAADLANRAAGLVVRRIGNYAPTAEELLDAL